jgi:acetolactate synthase-1/2/3 large subunit
VRGLFYFLKGFRMSTSLAATTTPIRETSRELSGSQILLELLIREGVDTIFGYPGGAIMPVYDALYDYHDKIKHILVRHEQGAAHAAEGFARSTGRVGVCMATSGPGATNLVTGIADAMLDSVPMVCITGQVARSFLGTDAFQETDIIGITTPITKWNFQVTNAEELLAIIPKAFRVAREGRPGPVLIDITKNAQFEKLTVDLAASTHDVAREASDPIDLSALRSAARLLNEANRPLMFVGQGAIISQAHDEIRAFTEKAEIPVASTLLGLSGLPTRHPLYVGMLGMHGNYGPNVLTNKADVIIAVGMRFDDRVTGKLSEYARQARIIHIDIDPAELNKNVQVEVGIISDARTALRALIPLVKQRSNPTWHSEFLKCYAHETEKVIARDLAHRDGLPTMSKVIADLGVVTRGDAVIVTDVGQHQMATARYYPFTRPRSLLTSGGLGTMGYGVPAAMGAAVGLPGERIVAIVGDGGFQMTLQELGTIRQSDLPVKIIILNNNFLGMVRQWQQLFFDKRYSFVQMDNPNFLTVAAAYDIPAARVSSCSGVHEALRTMWETPGPYLLEVVCEKEENIFPMIPAGAAVGDIRLE